MWDHPLSTDSRWSTQRLSCCLSLLTEERISFYFVHDKFLFGLKAKRRCHARYQQECIRIVFLHLLQSRVCELEMARPLYKVRLLSCFEIVRKPSMVLSLARYGRHMFADMFQFLLCRGMERKLHFANPGLMISFDLRY